MNFMPAAFRGAFFSADHFIRSFLNRYAKDTGMIGNTFRPAMARFMEACPNLFWLSLPNYFEGECSAMK